jgi:hypothetical protein
MRLDLRIPVGLMFSFVGVILVGFGLASNGRADIYTKSLGINVNLWWGLVLLAFGQIMFHLGRRGQKRLAQEPAEPARRATRLTDIKAGL